MPTSNYNYIIKLLSYTWSDLGLWGLHGLGYVRLIYYVIQYYVDKN